MATFYCLLVTSLPQTGQSLTDFSSSREKRNGPARFSGKGLGKVGHSIWPNFEQSFPSLLFSNLDGVVVTYDFYSVLPSFLLLVGFCYLIINNNNSKPVP